MDKEDIIRRALRFPIEPVLKRYIRYFGVSEEEAHEHELELKRYLVLAVLNREKNYAPKTPIVDLWQTFILFTLLYSEFCMTLGGGYIHYTPSEARVLSREETAQSYSNLIRDYQAVFKVQAPSHIWTRTTDQLQVNMLIADGDDRLAQRY
jgi:hypothetical protein